MDEFFGCLFMLGVLVIGGLFIAAVVSTDTDQVIVEPNEVDTVSVVLTPDTAAPVAKKAPPVVKVKEPVEEEKKPTKNVLIELDELNKEEGFKFIDLRTEN